MGADGFLHIAASSASTKTSRLLDLACPARVVVTSTPAAGSSLSGTASLDLAWTTLPQNVSLFVTGSFSMDPPTARLFQYDVATGTMGGFVGGFTLSQASVGTSIPVTPTAGTGYISELRYPGVYHLDGNSGGYCGRAQRYTYMR